MGAFVLIVTALLTQIAAGLCEVLFSPMADVDACLKVFITHTIPDVKHVLRLIMCGGVGVFMDFTEKLSSFVRED